MPEPDASPVRRAILAAFAALVLERRYETLRVTEIAARAGVGRATLYEHFQGKADIMLAAMEPILAALALAAAGRPARSYLKGVISHLWDRRSIGRPILNSTAAALVQRRLADMIEAQVRNAATTAAPHRLTANAAAAAQIAMLRTWLAGEVSCSAEDMTGYLLSCSRLTA